MLNQKKDICVMYLCKLKITMNTKTQFNFNDTSTAFGTRTDAELRTMYLLFSGMNNSTFVKLGTYLLIIALKLKLPIKYFIKSTVFKQFCGGETIDECEKTINKLAASNISAILDYSAEGEKNKKGFERNRKEMLKVIDAAAANKLPFCVIKLTGFASIEALTRIQAKNMQKGDQEQYESLKDTLEELVKRTYEAGLCIFIDAEESWVQDVIDELTYEMMRKYNNERPVVYNTYQLYRVASLDNLKEAHQELSAAGIYLGAKLVRGAYMEKERKRAEELGYADPIQENKANTDRDYDLALEYCLKNHDKIAVCAGTHNEASSAYLAELMEKYEVDPSDSKVYFSQLYGMSDTISYKVASEGYNVAKYLPYGEITKVMPYLIRRAEENTSIAGQASRELQLIQKEIKRRKQS
jgi:proline dehydrogenase